MQLVCVRQPSVRRSGWIHDDSIVNHQVRPLLGRAGGVLTLVMTGPMLQLERSGSSHSSSWAHAWMDVMITALAIENIVVVVGVLLSPVTILAQFSVLDIKAGLHYNLDFCHGHGFRLRRL